MVSPETAKLLALKESILKETPEAKMFLSARADKDIADMDMIKHAVEQALERRRLRAENARLKMHVDILKKATAFFARENP